MVQPFSISWDARLSPSSRDILGKLLQLKHLREAPDIRLDESGPLCLRMA